MDLEITLEGSRFSGKDCFSFVCHSLNAKTKIAYLKNIDRMRQVMVSSISHDLRTPLNGLMILLRCLDVTPEFNKALSKKFIKPSLHCADYLLNLINDILDYTQVNFKEELRVVYQPISLRGVFAEVQGLLQMKASMKKIQLLLEVDPEIPKVFNTDPRRLKQVLLNLSGNSLKFTFSGFVKIRAKFMPRLG